MASEGNILLLHNQLQDRMRVVSGLQCHIKSPSAEWPLVRTTTRISFGMYSTAFGERAERRRGGWCPVVPLAPDELTGVDEHVWAGWHEEWVCVSRREFELIGAGWTFFWGIEGRLGREQEILRAEWDQRVQRGGDAAQPHWHIDTELMVNYSPRRPVATAPHNEALEELPASENTDLEEISSGPIGIQTLSIAGMHLGMGGWSHSHEYPRCWQFDLCDDWDALVVWFERTLQAAKYQFGELRVVETLE